MAKPQPETLSAGDPAATTFFGRFQATVVKHGWCVVAIELLEDGWYRVVVRAAGQRDEASDRSAQVRLVSAGWVITRYDTTLSPNDLAVNLMRLRYGARGAR